MNIGGFFGNAANQQKMESEEDKQPDTSKEVDKEVDDTEPGEEEESEDAEAEDDDSEDETAEAEDSKKPEKKIDDTEKKRREQQSRADRLEAQNRTLLTETEKLRQELLDLKQQAEHIPEEDEFAGMDDSDLVTVAQQKKALAKLKQKQQVVQKGNKISEAEARAAQLWVQSQPDVPDIDKYYRENEKELTQILNSEGITTAKEGYYRIRTEFQKSEMTKKDELIDKLKRENKKLRKHGGKIPVTGPGGRSEPPKQQGMDINSFYGRTFNQKWNK